MTRIPKELMTPIKAKDPDEIDAEGARRMVLLKEHLRITDETTDSEFLKVLLKAVLMRTDQRGRKKGRRTKSDLSNFQRLVKISFCNQSGRAKNQEEAARIYGLSPSNFKKLRETNKVRWRYIQAKMSEFGEIENSRRKIGRENLSKTNASLEKLLADREKLVCQQQKLTSKDADEIDLMEEDIFLHDYLIKELHAGCKHWANEAELDIEAVINNMADQLKAPLPK